MNALTDSNEDIVTDTTTSKKLKVVLSYLGVNRDAMWFDMYKGTVFDVIEKYAKGYHVDMTPAGHRGSRGFFNYSEVEIYDETRERMKRFIRENYAEILGSDIRWLDERGGLDKLHKKYCLGWLV